MTNCFPVSESVRFYSLARHALVEALRLAGVGKGDSVLLPEFVCRDLLASLYAVGAVPAWYPLTADLRPSIPQEIWPAARAVVAVNYFGFPQPMDAFRTFAERTGAIIIEDNAHGFLSRDDAGRWLGTRGDLGIFSLRKTWPMADGAALLTTRQHLAAAFPPVAAEPAPVFGYAPNAKRKARLRRLPAGNALLGLTTHAVRIWRRLRTGTEIPAADPDAETSIPYQAVAYAGLHRELAAMDVEQEVLRRRSLYVELARLAPTLGAVPVFPSLPPFVVPYGFAYRPTTSGAPREIDQLARQHGLDRFRWPDLPQAIAQNAPEHYRNVHVVNFLW